MFEGQLIIIIMAGITLFTANSSEENVLQHSKIFNYVSFSIIPARQ